MFVKRESFVPFLLLQEHPFSTSLLAQRNAVKKVRALCSSSTREFAHVLQKIAPSSSEGCFCFLTEFTNSLVESSQTLIENRAHQKSNQLCCGISHGGFLGAWNFSQTLGFNRDDWNLRANKSIILVVRRFAHFGLISDWRNTCLKKERIWHEIFLKLPF